MITNNTASSIRTFLDTVTAGDVVTLDGVVYSVRHVEHTIGLVNLAKTVKKDKFGDRPYRLVANDTAEPSELLLSTVDGRGKPVHNRPVVSFERYTPVSLANEVQPSETHIPSPSVESEPSADQTAPNGWDTVDGGIFGATVDALAANSLAGGDVSLPVIDDQTAPVDPQTNSFDIFEAAKALDVIEFVNVN